MTETLLTRERIPGRPAASWRGVARGLAGSGGLGQPGVQPFPDLVRGAGITAPLVADDHGSGGGHAGEGGHSQHLVPAHVLRLERARREHQPG